MCFSARVCLRLRFLLHRLCDAEASRPSMAFRTTSCLQLHFRVYRFLKCLQKDGFGAAIVRHICHLLSSGEVDRGNGTVCVCGHSLGGAMAGLFAGV